MGENPMGALLQTTIREAYEGFSKGQVKRAIQVSRFVTLILADVIFVNGLPFLVTISRDI